MSKTNHKLCWFHLNDLHCKFYCCLWLFSLSQRIKGALKGSYIVHSTHTQCVTVEYRWSLSEARKHLKEHKIFITYRVQWAGMCTCAGTYQCTYLRAHRALLMSAFAFMCWCIHSYLIGVLCMCVCIKERIYTVMVIFIQDGVSFLGDVLTHTHVTLATNNRCGCRWSMLSSRAIIQLDPPPPESSNTGT